MGEYYNALLCFLAGSAALNLAFLTPIFSSLFEDYDDT